jgi:aminoglycoside phosphotransferase
LALYGQVHPFFLLQISGAARPSLRQTTSFPTAVRVSTIHDGSARKQFPSKSIVMKRLISPMNVKKRSLTPGRTLGNLLNSSGAKAKPWPTMNCILEQRAAILAALPGSLSSKLRRSRWSKINVGKSPARVYKIVGSDSTYFLKAGLIYSHPRRCFLSEELLRLEWLRGRLVVPEVVSYYRTEAIEILISRSLPGATFAEKAKKMSVSALRSTFRAIFSNLASVPYSNCPFSQSMPVILADAEDRLKLALVDKDDFDPNRAGVDPIRLLRDLRETHWLDEDLVFSHGDLTLSNILLENGNVGFVDVGCAGVADRHRDAGTLLHSVQHILGDDSATRLAKTTIPRWNLRKLEWFTALNEFF